MLLRETFPVGSFECNCTVLACGDTKEAVVIDPGGDTKRIVERCEYYHLEVKAIIHTHAHLDHIMGTGTIAADTGAPAMLHPGDDWLYKNMPMQGMFMGMKVEQGKLMDAELRDGQVLDVGDAKLEVVHTPGHGPETTVGDEAKANPFVRQYLAQ